MKEESKSKFKFSTKANTLLLLRDNLRHALVLDIVLFTVEEFIYSQLEVLKKIQSVFSNQTLIIRSSAKAEDGKHRTLAGHFKSILNVNSDKPEEIVSAINDVIASYISENYNKNKLYRQQIFIQRQIKPEEIEISGVAFSYDPHSQAPYFFVNYDNNGSTNAVTSGLRSKSIYLHRTFDNHSHPWGQLVKALKEIEEIFAWHKIDVEFAILKNGQIVIFQARKLFTQNKCLNIIKYDGLVQRSFGFIENSDDIFSDMSFWNPAEMIGCEPHPLDYSLYETLITKTAWNEGLVRMGYTFDASNLMICIGNHPYISIKKTANSLIPQMVNENIRTRAVQHCLNYIRNNPSAHDKIEFEVIYNCAYKGMKNDLEIAYGDFLSDEELNEFYLALFNLTRDSIINYSIVKSQDLSTLDKLRKEQSRFKTQINNRMGICALVSLIREHIKAVLSYVSPQFAFHARCAFISKKLLNSVVDNKILTTDEIDGFLSSIPTIVTDFLSDMCDKKISDKELVEKYGHLRNSTYNILSKKYADIGISRLRGQNFLTGSPPSNINNIKIFKSLSEFFSCSIEEIEGYIIGSIQMREQLKFEYSRSVSLILDAIEFLAQKLLMTTDEIAFVSLDDILKIHATSDETKLSIKFKSLSSRNKHKYDRNLALLCPAVITAFSDCFEVNVCEDRPNFVTNKKVIADVVLCTDRMLNEDLEELDLDGKIVVLEKAEPGNDWIFSKYKIAGLIAKYGGTASHMAIRCLEQGIPAALGCGEKIFRYVSECLKISLDCKSEAISKIA
ncbi:MAG: PEP-utilizing enzyme [Clostridia bacterium]|nr:PEP-utilizing enzyme [Clostridia bacterium]